ncbi:MAG: iron-sulfur cluster-binding protein [SAR202 cluster bacterium]|nr:iron-sulfur cluster-binding protein [SAR202 cluster bacterium]
MEVKTRAFKGKANETLADPVLQKSLENVYSGFHLRRIQAGGATPGWDEQRDRARAIKAHTIANLDYYLDMLVRNVEAKGGKVHFADDGKEAARFVVDLARSRGVKTVIKSKSMVSEEIGLNDLLEAESIEPVETDLGEYIIQLARETPYHIIAPAIHKTPEQVAELLAAKSGGPKKTTAKEMTAVARTLLRDAFQRADMGVTGVNFAVAETGSITLVTNEGNGRMCTSAPRIHVALMGMEKVVPSMADLSAFLRILIRSATGQRISAYVSVVNGPRAAGDEDGPEEFHLVIVDNNRSRLLKDAALRESLYCIRCGACMNACPVYRKVGGHSYGWVYPGPIGAVVSPVMSGLKEGKALPFASSLCGACREVCPVRIDIPSMLLHLRSELAEGADRSQRSAGVVDRASFRLWRFGMSGRGRFDLGARLVRFVLWPLSRRGWTGWLPFPLGGWTSTRRFKVPAGRSFVARWRNRQGGA